MRISKLDLSHFLSYLPDLEDLDLVALPEACVLILAQGFEDRSTNILGGVLSRGKLADSMLLIVKYPTNLGENTWDAEFLGRAKSSCRRFRQITYCRETFAGDLKRELVEWSLQEQSTTNVVVDISSMASYVMYPLLAELVAADTTLDIVYTEAATYYPSEAEWKSVSAKAKDEKGLFKISFEEADFQSVGVASVYTASIFDEFNPGNLPSRLIAVPNFSPLRMNAIVEKDAELNKSRSDQTVWLIGQPPREELGWRGDAVRSTNALNNVPSVQIKSVCTLDYKEMLETLEGIWLDSRNTYYLSIGNLGSKMQHLGSFLFGLAHRDTSFWLAEPTQFKATRFSTDFGPAHRVSLGETKKLREVVEKYGTFEWDWDDQ
ncbi:MAG: hypothetical protein K8J08_22650 [Thermoanaerobaculia bacterium]|nr:hypothetical protein [Thermoanaerobaculia bacterium]